MEAVSASSFSLSVVLVIIVTWVWSVLNWVWLRPKKLERYLRQQSLAGNSYRLLVGDMEESSMMLKEAKYKPMNLSHDIVPRVPPFEHQSVNTYVSPFDEEKMSPAMEARFDQMNASLTHSTARLIEMTETIKALSLKMSLGFKMVEDLWHPCKKLVSTSDFEMGKTTDCASVSEFPTFKSTVTMILHEALRLYPAVVALSRTTHKKTQLGKFSLPAGVEISINPLLVHHDKELWGDDANEFNPKRFSEGVSKATKNKFTYFPFGGGPRICIGQNFAMMEAKLALSLILQHFTFELSPAYAHSPSAIITLHPQYGAHIVLHKR